MLECNYISLLVSKVTFTQQIATLIAKEVAVVKIPVAVIVTAIAKMRMIVIVIARALMIIRS